MLRGFKRARGARHSRVALSRQTQHLAMRNSERRVLRDQRVSEVEYSAHDYALLP